MFLSVLSEDFLTSFPDATARVAMRDMSKGTEREVRPQLTSKLLNKSLPHQSSSCVIWEGEVYSLVKEFLEVFLTSFIWFTCATNDSNPRRIIYEFTLPF